MDEDLLAIGRNPRLCQLVFPGNATDISKRHCILRYDVIKRVFLLEDAWSANGTFLISGEHVRPGTPYMLKPGDRFYLSDPNNLFEVGLEKES